MRLWSIYRGVFWVSLNKDSSECWSFLDSNVYLNAYLILRGELLSWDSFSTFWTSPVIFLGVLQAPVMKFYLYLLFWSFLGDTIEQPKRPSPLGLVISKLLWIGLGECTVFATASVSLSDLSSRILDEKKPFEKEIWSKGILVTFVLLTRDES